MKIFKNKRYAIFQVIILLIIVCVILLIAALTYDNGLPNEEPFLSADPNSENYFMNKLNSPDMSLSSPAGYGYEEFIEEKFPNAKLSVAYAWDEMMQRVAYSKDTAFLVEESSTASLRKTMDNIYFFDESVGNLQYCYATAKTEFGSTLCLQINQFTAKKIEDGSLERLQEKWRYFDEHDYALEPVEFDPNGEVIDIAIDPEWMPMSFILNGNKGSVGYFVDHLNLFCEEYGYVPNYSSISSFSSASMGLDSGAYDICAIGLIYTDDRADEYNITKGVIDDPVLVGVRASSVMDIDLGEYVKDAGFFDSIKNSLQKNIVEHNRWQMLLAGLLNTIIISLGSIVFGTLFGALICLMKRCKNIIISSFARLYINIFQRMPSVLLLLILCYVIFTGDNIPELVICIITFALILAPSVAETLGSGIDAVPIGQWNASLALGFTKPQTFFRIILPQVLQIVMPIYKADVITTVLETSVAGYVAVQDLTKMSDYIRASTFQAITPMLITAIIYFVLTLCIGFLLTKLEKRLNPRSYRRLPKWVLKIKDKQASKN